MPPLFRHTLAALVGAGLAGSLLYVRQRAHAIEAQALRADNEARRQQLARTPSTAPTREKAVGVPATDTALPPAELRPDALPPPLADYRFEGQATPVNALQSFAWACDQGDIPAMKTLITFDSAARPLAEAYFASLPVALRAKTPDVETLAAMLLIDDGIRRPFPRAELLARATVEPLSAQRARTRLPGTPRDGAVFAEEAGAWKYVITQEAVERYLHQVVKK